jgi:hypothetical protein
MEVSHVILLTCGSVGILCSILTLWIIYRMNRMNGYLKLILTLTISQLLYDISIVLVTCHWYPIKFFYISLRSMSGLWATFITNILSFVVLYTVWTSQVIDLAKNIRYILPTLFIPATLYGIVAPYVIFYSSDYIVHIVSSVYFWIRVASIIFNIFSYLGMVYKLHLMDSLWLPPPSSVSPSLPKPTHSPLWALAHRFKYYPIVQIITRLPVAIHEYSYGHDYGYPEHGSLREKISLITYVVFLPAAGLGFFLVFITVCPGAFQRLKDDLKYPFSSFDFHSNQIFSRSTPEHNSAHQETISQLFSSRLSEATDDHHTSRELSPSFLELSERGTRESSVISDDDDVRYSTSISYPSMAFKEYRHWNEDELVAEIGRMYSVDPSVVVR